MPLILCHGVSRIRLFNGPLQGHGAQIAYCLHRILTFLGSVRPEFS